MSRAKEIFMYILALTVLLAPAIILGWIGLSLLGWVGLIVGVIGGLVIFAFSVNKIAAQDEELEAQETEEPELTPSSEATAPTHQEAR